MDGTLYVCILAGGRGERLWPLSRRDHPKQVQDLTGDGPLIRLAYERSRPLSAPERTIVVTGGDLTGVVAEAVPDVPGSQIIGEPVGRTSAPAVALAAAWVARRDPTGTFLVAASDHLIGAEPFREALAEAADHARTHGDLVTFGIEPTRPDTGYGYIEVGEPVHGRMFRAAGFREKPDAATAMQFVETGRFLWNSGLFVWRADAILGAIQAHAPELSSCVARLEFDADGSPTANALARFYAEVPAISIDYAVMEHAANIAVCRSGFPWCDVGGWSAIGDVVGEDDRQVATHARSADTPLASVDCEDVVLYSDGGPVAAIGVSDLCVVRVGEVTMVCPRSAAGRVRDLVTVLRDDPRWAAYL